MAVLTRDQIKALITANIIENGAYAITPAMIAEIVTDIVDSFALLGDSVNAIEVASVNINAPEVGLKVSGTKVVGAQEVGIAHLAGDASLANCITAINALATALENHGLIAVPI